MLAGALAQTWLSQLKGLLPRGRAAVLRVGVCMLAGAMAGYLLSPHRTTTIGGHGAPPMTVSLGGVTLASGGDQEQLLDQARDVARKYLTKTITVAVPGGATKTMTREDLGARVDDARLASLVTAIRDDGSALRRHRASAGTKTPLQVPVPVSIDAERALAAVLTLKDTFDKAPTDARLDVTSRKVTNDEPGLRVDAYATLARVDAALTSDVAEIAVVAEPVQATRTAAQINGVSFEDTLGYFETKYARDRKHEARTFNLRLAASKFDGHVLMPGETFDFNEVVGPRNEANGYKVAPVIAQGELVDGIGGGTCQVAGTLHGAAFFAGLDIVERRPHTRPSFYIKMGMDATVVYPTITLKLRNPFPYPVVLHETVREGVVRAEVLGPKRTRDVMFVRKINEVAPFQEKEVMDPKVPKGERVLLQRGIPSFKITRYRILRDGAFAVRERMQDVYPSTTQIWRVGTGDTDPKFTGHDDEHPEYVADEYLAIAQGPHVVNPRTGAATEDRGGATVETRVAGKYGTHGWTVKAGFAKATSGTRNGKSSGRDNEEDNPGVD